MRRLLPLLAAVLIPVAAPAQEPAKPRVTIPYDGPEIFARLLDHAGLEPLKTLDDLDRTRPEELIVLVFGDAEPLTRIAKHARGLARLRDAGTAFCVATDRAFDFGVLQDLPWNAEVVGSSVTNDSKNFAGERRCPLALPAGDFAETHPLFRGVRTLATNCPSEFNPRRKSALPTLAFLPWNSESDRVKRFTWSRWPDVKGEGIALLPAVLPRPLVLGSGPADRERDLLVAGHGVFMNCMLIQDDAQVQNRRFALNAIRWLQGDGAARKRHALFYHEGRLRADFKLPLLAPPQIPLPSAAALNRVMDAVQKEALLQRLVEQTIGPEKVAQGLIVAATLGLLVYGLMRFFQSRHTAERTPLLVGIPEPRTRPLAHQQMRELASRGQLGEPAQALARGWFRDVAGVEPAAAGASYELRAGFFARRRLRRQVKEVWTLAAAQPPAGWTQARLLALGRTLEELTAALRAGALAFPQCPAGGRP